jgi:DNA-binding NarL/FixJ family response regulator
MIKTVIIGNQKQDIDKINSILTASEDIKVLARGKDGYDALKLISSLKPDIAILDNQLEFIEGDEIPPLLRARSPLTAVVILIASASDYQLYRAASNNVSGFVCKKTEMDRLPMILKCVSEGGCFISPHLAGRILQILSSAEARELSLKLCSSVPAKNREKFPEAVFPAIEDPTGFLSKMELLVLTEIGEGYTSAEIAENLNLAVGTVRNYVSSIMRKTGMNNRTQMARFALHYSLIPLNQ